MRKQISIYLAGPLFTQAEWLWNASLAQSLARKGLTVFLPQVVAEPMLSGKARFDASEIFNANIAHLRNCDVVLAVLDQPDPDSGTCWECGYAYRLGKPIVGLRTDIRRLSEGSATAVNLMLGCSCAAFVELPLGSRDDLAWVADEVAKKIHFVWQAKEHGGRSEE